MTSPITPTPIDELPPAPLITDTPAQFDDKAFPFAAALDDFRSQANTLASQTNQNAVAAKEGGAAAAQSETNAGLSAAAAAQSETNAGLSAAAAAQSETNASDSQDWMARRDLGPHATFPTVDNQGRPLLVGAEFLYTGVTPNTQYRWDGTQWIVGLQVTAGVTQLNGKTGAVSVKTINGNDILTSGDLVLGEIKPRAILDGEEIDVPDLARFITPSGNATVDVSSGTNSGWWCYVSNPEGAAFLLNASINGRLAWPVYKGQTYILKSDGAHLTAVLVSGESAIQLKHEVASGISAQTLTSGTWNSRDVNTIFHNSIPGASLSSNEITLPPGLYKVGVTACASANSAGIKSRLRLYNVSDSSALLYGAVTTTPGSGQAIESDINGYFEIATQKVIRVEHYFAGSGFGGLPLSISGISEIYATIVFTKVG